jgi:hypothetical protein
MLARQMTAGLQAIRDSRRLGESKQLANKGVSFGWLTRQKDGLWDTSRVAGLPRASIIAKLYDHDSLIEFLKTLQVLPPGTPHLVVDENFHEKHWGSVRSSELTHNQ